MFLKRRLAAIFGSIGIGIQGILFTDYDIPGQEQNKKHIFTDIQSSFRTWRNQYYYIPSSSSDTATAINNNNNNSDNK